MSANLNAQTMGALKEGMLLQSVTFPHTSAGEGSYFAVGYGVTRIEIVAVPGSMAYVPFARVSMDAGHEVMANLLLAEVFEIAAEQEA